MLVCQGFVSLLCPVQSPPVYIILKPAEPVVFKTLLLKDPRFVGELSSSEVEQTEESLSQPLWVTWPHMLM